MAHKFDPDHMGVLDMEERKKIFPPEGALAAAGLKEGDVLADIGCGTGYLSIPAARLVGEQGRVYGFDTSEKMLDELKRRVREEGLSNVVPVLSGEYEMPLDGSLCSHAVVSSVFHEVDDRPRFARAVGRILAPGGRLLVFEMKPGAAGVGPPEHHRISPERVEGDLEAAGFTVTKSADLTGHFYYVIAEKLLNSEKPPNSVNPPQ